MFIWVFNSIEFVAVFLWIAFQLGCSTTWKRLVFHILTSKQWGFTRVCGMLITGQHKEGEWRLIGQKLLLLLIIGTSAPMLVFIRKDHHRPVCRRPSLSWRMIKRGRIMVLMLKEGIDFVGCKRSTWFTTTALTSNASLKAYPRNARDQDSSRRIYMMPGVLLTIKV